MGDDNGNGICSVVGFGLGVAFVLIMHFFMTHLQWVT